MDELEEIFYDPATGFGSIADTHRIAKERGLDVSKRQVSDFLEQQEVTDLFREKRKRRKKRKGEGRRPKQQAKSKPIAATVEDDNWQMDLMDFRNEKPQNNGYGFVMLVMDSFTRQLYAAPMRTKSGDESLKSFRDIVSKVGDTPNVLLTDNESGFVAAPFQQYLRQHNIKHVLIKSAGTVERAIRTIKGWMERHFHEIGVRRWIDDLPDFIDRFNNMPNRTIQAKPKELDEEDGDPVKLQEAITRETDRIEKQTEEAEGFIGKEVKKFKPGDTVRIEVGRGAFKKGARAKRTAQTYRVVRTEGSSVVVDVDGLEMKFSPFDLTKAKAAIQPAQTGSTRQQRREARQAAAGSLPEANTQLSGRARGGVPADPSRTGRGIRRI